MYTVPAYRGRSIARNMVSSACHRVQSMGYNHLWLMTIDQHHLYGQLGFHTLETMNVFDERYTMMRKDFIDTSPPVKKEGAHAISNHTPQ